MNETQSFITKIRALVGKNDLKEAIRQLQALLDNSRALDEAILQSARLNDISRQIRLGLVDHAQANLTKNQIRAGVLDLLEEIETQESATPTLRAEVERAVSIVNSKNVVIDSTIQAGGDVHIGDKTIIQNAEKIYNIDKIDNANFS